jgi:hypothetical protein
MEVSTQSAELEQISDWKAEIVAAKDVLRSMRNQLEQATTTKTNEDSRIQIEHFQNQFIRQLEVADELNHDLRQSAKKIANNGQVAISHDDRPIDNSDVLQDRVQTFNKLYSELQQEFDAFIAFS